MVTGDACLGGALTLLFRPVLTLADSAPYTLSSEFRRCLLALARIRKRVEIKAIDKDDSSLI